MAQAVTAPSAGAEALACPVDGCKQTFYDKSGIGRHLDRVHEVKRDSAEYRRLMGLRDKNAAREERKQATSYAHQVEQRIHEMTKPLQDELRGINKRLSEIDMEGVELRAARKRIEQVLRQLDPTSFVATLKKSNRVGPTHVGSDEMREAKQRAVLQFLEANRDKYGEGLTAAEVYRDMKAAGVEPISAPNKIKEQIESLHANGVLRADRKIRGGAMQYKIVANGGSDGA